MLVDLPVLEDYDISPTNGFLSKDLPLVRLPSPYFDPWETIAENIPVLIMTGRLRAMVLKLPQMDLSQLKHEQQWRRAYSLLGFLAHSYVWGNQSQPIDVLPDMLADSWKSVSDRLEMPPISTFASLVLWNIKLIDPSAGITLDNLTTITTYTGSVDEMWFYTTGANLEKAGAPCLTYGLDAIRACREGDSAKVVTALQGLAEAIDHLGCRMFDVYEKCDPYVFYNHLRPFLSGWSNMAEVGLEDGVKYGSKATEYRKFAGASNAQSSVVQTLDILLQVEHHPTGTKVPSPERNGESDNRGVYKTPSKNPYLEDMRSYMPKRHKQFLEHLEKVAPEIKQYVLSHEKDEGIVVSYDACLAMLKVLRDKHMQLVSRYVLIPSRRKASLAQAERPDMPTAYKASNAATTGTGGTALVPFLKQIRDETTDGAVGSWGRRLLTVQPSALRVAKSSNEKVEDRG